MDQFILLALDFLDYIPNTRNANFTAYKGSTIHSKNTHPVCMWPDLFGLQSSVNQ